MTHPTNLSIQEKRKANNKEIPFIANPLFFG